MTLVGLERKATREFGGGNALRCLRGSEIVGYIINVFIWYREILFHLWWAVCLDMYPGETRKHGKSDVIYAIWSIQSDGG